MIAGEIFTIPDGGDLRVRVGMVNYFMPTDSRADNDGNVCVRGLIVQEYDEEYGWCDICPLVDFPAMEPLRVNDLPRLGP